VHDGCRENDYVVPIYAHYVQIDAYVLNNYDFAFILLPFLQSDKYPDLFNIKII